MAPRLHRVSIEALTESSDGHDGLTDHWTCLKTRWSAHVKPLAGRDLERAQQIDNRISHEVTFAYWREYWRDLKGGRVRLVYHRTSNPADDRYFEIVGAPLDVGEQHVELTMPCRELV